jgi:hypothetical protein
LTVLIVACALPFVALFAFMATQQSRREARAMRGFAALLAGGQVKQGKAFGQWQGTNVQVSFFGRLSPPVFLTGVTASRRVSPFVALLLPSTADESAPALAGIPELQRRFPSAGCAPRELFGLFADQATVALLNSLSDTEVEVLPDRVNVQRREILDDAAQLRPLLDAATQLARRLDQLHDELVGETNEQWENRMAQVKEFLASVR